MTHPYHAHGPVQAFAPLPFSNADEAADATLAARLRAHYAAAYLDAGRRDLSVAELADVFARGDERQVQRAHALLRRTYGARFVELQQVHGRQLLSVVRWIEPPASELGSRGVPADPRISYLEAGYVDLRDRRRRRDPSTTPPTRSESRSHRANADPARVRTRAPGSTSPGSRARARRRAVRLELEQPALMRLAPVRIEGELRAALDGRYGPGTASRLESLANARGGRLRPAEALLAARTLLERRAAVPGALWTELFKRACGGDTLCDRGAEREAVRLAELELLTGPADLPPDEQRERLEQLEHKRAAARDPGHAAELGEAITLLRQRLEQRGEPDPERDRMLAHLAEIEARKLERDRREARGPPPTAPPDDPVARARGYALLPAELRLEIPEYRAVLALVAWWRT